VTSADGIRIRVNATAAALIFALLSGGAGVVYAAAKVSAAVETYQSATDDLRRTLYSVRDGMQDLRERVGVLEDRSTRPSYPHSMIPRLRSPIP
jgi:hypothetical protein